MLTKAREIRAFFFCDAAAACAFILAGCDGSLVTLGRDFDSRLDIAMPHAELRSASRLALGLTLVAGLASPDAIAAEEEGSGQAKAPPAADAPAPTSTAVANADWLKAQPGCRPRRRVSAMGQLAERAQQQQRDLLDAAMTAPQGNVQKLLGDFWASGLDEAAVEARRRQSGRAAARRASTASRRRRTSRPSIAALHQVGIPVAFNFGADIDLQRPRPPHRLLQPGRPRPARPGVTTRAAMPTRAR